MSYHLLHSQKKRISLILPFFIILTMLNGCSQISFSTNEDKAFRKFTHDLFCREVSSNTISLHYTLRNPADYGISDCPVTYGSFPSDPDAALASIENCQASLHQFHPASLSEENRLTYEILDSYLDTSSQMAEYLLYQDPLSPITGIHAQLPVLLSEFQFYSVEDAETYLELLEDTDDYFDSLIAFENARIDVGMFMPDYQVDSVTSQCISFVEMGEDNYLYETFEERLDSLELSDEERSSLISQNDAALQNVIFPAYLELADSLNALKGNGTNEKGLCYLPDGKTYYEILVRSKTGISDSIEDLKEMTQKQIIEDLTAMEEVLYSDQLLSVLDSMAPSSMLNDLRQKINGAFPEIPDVETSVKYVPTALEDYLSPAFYMIPAIDNISENVIYINQGQTSGGLSLYTTLAHEGYPGHLYQTVYFSSQNADPIRSLLDFGGYVEGWATYAEMMSYYMAPISKPEASLYQKNTSVLLGLYTLADIGIHYDGWTLIDTAVFFKDYGITDLAAIQNLYELIVGDPANYLKYYLGYLEFLNLKKEIAGTQGDDFSQKEFHKAVLDVGPAPFDIVYESVRKALSN
ncbi:MAG: DUF885 domain-containing protein [Bariatricus sp.]